MSVETYKVVLNKIKNHPIEEIKLMGMGEPFLHPKFSEICRLTKETFPNAKIISATTGQFKLSGNFKRSLEFIDLLYLSIDGYGETYEKFRKPAKWSKLLKFLSGLKECDRFNCKIAINYTINPDNVYDIPKVERLLERFNLDELRLNVVQNWSEDEKVEGIINGFKQEDIEFLKTYRKVMKGRPIWDYNDCFWVKEGLYMSVNGDVKICCMNTSAKPVGNLVFDPAVSQSFSNKRFIEIADGCKNNQPTEHCKNCSYKELTKILQEIL
jgi:MoaA/NifB/PqqE/SkfB family radical SAM enzyme